MKISPDSPKLFLVGKYFTGKCISCNKEIARIKTDVGIVKVPYVAYKKVAQNCRKRKLNGKEWKEENLSYVNLEIGSRVTVIISNVRGYKLYGMVV